MTRRFSYQENGVTPNTKCILCEETAKKIRKEYGDYAIVDGCWSEKLEGWVCGPCRESSDYDPKGTVIVYIPREKKVEKWIVKDYEDELYVAKIESPEDLEEPEFDFEDAYYVCPIQFEWHHTDPWRGYYSPTSKGFKEIHEDAILAYSEDAEQLKEFHSELIRTLWSLGVEFAIAYGRTSNLFSAGYDVLVKKEDLEDPVRSTAIQAALNLLKLSHRDPERFILTALTGKGGGFDEKDRLLAEAYKKLQAGESPEQVQKYVLEKLGGEKNEEDS